MAKKKPYFALSPTEKAKENKIKRPPVDFSKTIVTQTVSPAEGRIRAERAKEIEENIIRNKIQLEEDEKLKAQLPAQTQAPQIPPQQQVQAPPLEAPQPQEQPTENKRSLNPLSKDFIGNIPTGDMKVSNNVFPLPISPAGVPSAVPVVGSSEKLATSLGSLKKLSLGKKLGGAALALGGIGGVTQVIRGAYGNPVSTSEPKEVSIAISTLGEAAKSIDEITAEVAAGTKSPSEAAMDFETYEAALNNLEAAYRDRGFKSIPFYAKGGGLQISAEIERRKRAVPDMRRRLQEAEAEFSLNKQRQQMTAQRQALGFE